MHHKIHNPPSFASIHNDVSVGDNTCFHVRELHYATRCRIESTDRDCIMQSLTGSLLLVNFVRDISYRAPDRE